MTNNEALRVIISGGGTGGHIFPAIAIANAIKVHHPEAEILFVGAEGRMEMTRVPAAGYPIVGLPVSGFDRKNLLKNIRVLYRLARSRHRARKIVDDFRPMVAVGVGGYASGPTLEAAAARGIPILLQEQNSYAGLTNKILAKKAACICVAYDNMERFFPADRIVLTGNPVRQELLLPCASREAAAEAFQLDASRPTVLIVGGSLGARTLNESVLSNLALIRQSDVQFIWQTGSFYREAIAEELKRRNKPFNLYVTDFISSMPQAYALADLVISRAGASSISELCLLRKPAILVPSPNVAEDHQTKNAMALVEKEAALLVADSEAVRTLIPRAINVVQEPDTLARLGANIGKMAHPNAADVIAEEACRLAAEYRAQAEEA